MDMDIWFSLNGESRGEQFDVFGSKGLGNNKPFAVGVVSYDYVVFIFHFKKISTNPNPPSQKKKPVAFVFCMPLIEFVALWG